MDSVLFFNLLNLHKGMTKERRKTRKNRKQLFQMNNISLKKVLFSEKNIFPDGKLTKISCKKLFVLYKTSRGGEGKTICKNWNTNKLHAKDRSQTLKNKEICFFDERTMMYF